MKTKHLSLVALAMIMGVATYAQDSIPQKDTTKKDTTTIPEKTDTTKKDTPAVATFAMVNSYQDTTKLPKKDTTDKPKKDTTSSFAFVNVPQKNIGFLKGENGESVLPKLENKTV